MILTRKAFFFLSVLLTACGQNPKLNQYTVQGERLYEQHCANCHQSDGTGLGRVYPPLKNSEYLNRKPAELAQIIRQGLEGSIIVAGKEYNQVMKGNLKLSDLEIAEMLTYINVTWGNGTLVSAREVQE